MVFSLCTDLLLRMGFCIIIALIGTFEFVDEAELILEESEFIIGMFDLVS